MKTKSTATTATIEALAPQSTEVKPTMPALKLPQSYGFKPEQTGQRIQDAKATFTSLLSTEGKQTLARATGEVVKTPLAKKFADHSNGQKLAILIASASLNLEAVSGVKLADVLSDADKLATFNKTMMDAYATHASHLVESKVTANRDGLTATFSYANKASDYTKEVNAKHKLAQCGLKLATALGTVLK